MSRTILIDRASRDYLALRLSICLRPALIDEADWRAFLRAEVASMDISILAVLVDLAGEPNLVDGMARASRLYARALLVTPEEESEWRRVTR